MSLLVSLFGSGAGIVIIGSIFVASLHMGRMPAIGQAILRRAFIVGMYAGGSALAVTEAGTIWTRVAGWVASYFGGLGSGIPRAVLVLVCFLLLLSTVAGLIWAPNEGVIVTAAFLPCLLMLIPGGFLHHVYVSTTYPAQQIASQFSAWIGG